MSSLVDIDSKGYGKIYKSVMRDRNLPLLAKTIYAYFCAYAGCGCQAFPKREKILNDLQINKDTFTFWWKDGISPRSGLGQEMSIPFCKESRPVRIAQRQNRAKAICWYLKMPLHMALAPFPSW